nr:MAG TPA: hypothetical protein [Caudoviricetes sp.]
MLNYIEYLGIPLKIALVLVALFFVMQIIGEFLEFKGKVVPELFKIRKFFSRKKKERAETIETLREVRQLLNDVNIHYSDDNIAKRDNWMAWVNSKSQAYDDSIVEISRSLSDITQALKDNTKLTEEMFIQSSRDRIIDFATKTSNENVMVSREEFYRIFKVYDKYEKFLEEREMSNGEVDIAYQIIKESYEQHLRNHTFIEDIRSYTQNE